jgi:rhamnulokinase
MEKKNYLIFDFGANSGRGIIAEYDGKRFDLKNMHKFSNRPVLATNTLYWDILRLYSELKIGIQASLEEYNEITSIGIDTWSVDFGFIDKNGKLIANPIHYRDKTRNSVSDELYKIISKKELFKLTGGQIVSEVSLFNLFSLKINNSTELLKAYRFMMIPDIFNYFLTGIISNEFTVSSTTLMFNQKERTWQREIFKKLDIPQELFNEVVNPGTELGYISGEICNELSIRPLKVIAPATHDTASAVIGIPVSGKAENWAFISVGTWCVIGIETKDIILSDKVIGTGYYNEGEAEGNNLFVKDINGLWIIQQCREKWIRDKGSDISWDEIDESFIQARPFKSLINPDEPVFFETQNDMPEKIIEYCKRTAQHEPQNINEISRCIYESLSLRFRYDLEVLGKLTGKKIELLHLIGGGIRNKFLCQFTANATGIPVIAGPAECTSVGNLTMQLIGSKEIKNLKEGREISKNSCKVINYLPEEKSLWDEAYLKFKKLIVN